MTTTKENLANPGPVGLCGFALTTWLLSLINGGFFTAQEGVGLVLGMALAFGGIAQVIAGMFEFKKGNTFGFTLLSAMAPSGGHGLCLPSFLKVKQPRHLSAGISAHGVCFR